MLKQELMITQLQSDLKTILQPTHDSMTLMLVESLRSIDVYILSCYKELSFTGAPDGIEDYSVPEQIKLKRLII